VAERVVLLHSALGDSRLWERQVALLREHGYDAVAPDLPGFGGEPMPTEPFSFVAFVAELLPRSSSPTRSAARSHCGRRSRIPTAFQS
jgi:pimeloyl-ACP methyl ester carboxylesterase